jgi:CHAT domain-containing protein
MKPDESLPAELALDLACPQCGQAMHLSVPQLLDLQVQPQRRAQIVQRTLHDVDCPHCRSLIHLPVPIAVWEPTRRLILTWHPQYGDAMGLQTRVNLLVASLRQMQPAAAHAQCHDCVTHGALANALLEGFWDAPESAGLQAQGIWRKVFPLLPTASRVRVLDLLIEGDQKAVLEEAERDPALGAALRRAIDPQQQVYTPTLEAALQAVHLRDSLEPAGLIGSLAVGLVECARNPQPTAHVRNRLHAEIAVAARRLPLDDDAAAVQAWSAWPARLPAALPPLDRSIALFNIAGSAFDRLAAPYGPPLAGVVEALFDLALASQPPDDLLQLIEERRATLQRRSSVAPAMLTLEKDIEVADRLWHTVGGRTTERFAEAAELYRGVVAARARAGPSADLVLARLNLANILLDNPSGNDAALVEEALSVLAPLEGDRFVTTDPALESARLAALAMACKRRQLGDPQANMEQAIALWRRALEQGDTNADDTLSAATHYNLANALLRRQTGVRRENLAESLQLHEQVQRAREASAAPAQLQARSWLAIGNVHYESALLATPPDATDLQAAIAAYRRARHHLDAEALPGDAALAATLEGQTHALLAPASDSVDSALACYADAEQSATLAGDVLQREDLYARRGSLLFKLQHWSAAAQAYTAAARDRRGLMAKAISGATRERNLAAMAPYAARLAYALIQCGKLDDAIDALHAARTIDLQAAWRGVRADDEASSKYRRLRAQIIELEDAEREASAESVGAADFKLHRIHEELSRARLELACAADDLTGDDAADAMPSGYARLRLALPAGVLLALPVVTSAGTALVFATQREEKVSSNNIFDLKEFTANTVNTLLGIAPGRDDGGWRQIASDLARVEAGVDRSDIAQRLARFMHDLGRSPLFSALRERLAETGDLELRVVANGGLQSLPLPMAVDPESDNTLAQQVVVVAQISLVAEPSRARPTAARKRMLVVADPRDDLPFARWEAALIVKQAAEHGVDVQLLQGFEATADMLLARISSVDMLHFAGHAAHDWHDASRSGLLCADRHLPVAELRVVTERAPLDLVVLSACDSGLSDTTRLPDEFIGLPAAFFALGAQTVIASMWSIPDEATSLLMAEFYAQALGKNLGYGLALNLAQRRIAGATAAELDVAQRLQDLYEAGGRSDARLARRALAHLRRPDERPFAHPLYWGAHLCQQR